MKDSVIMNPHTVGLSLSWVSPVKAVSVEQGPEDLSASLPQSCDEGVCSSIEITRCNPLLVSEIDRRTVCSCPCCTNNCRASGTIAAAEFKLFASSSFSRLRLINRESVKSTGQLAVKVHLGSELVTDIPLPR